MLSFLQCISICFDTEKRGPFPCCAVLLTYCSQSSSDDEGEGLLVILLFIDVGNPAGLLAMGPLAGGMPDLVRFYS